jgi:steroid 5-alpha reductase family enzyme
MSATAATPWSWNLLITAAVALAFMSGVFVVGAVRQKHRTVDVAWGLAFTLVALTTFAASSGHGDVGRRVLATALTAVWGVRLAVHIASRGRGAPEDPRYEAFLAKAKGSRAVYAYTRIYLLQGALVWFISLPVQAVQFGTGGLGPLAVLGALLWALGLFFESVGDWQLARFKADPANKGRLMDRGLWRYTRHPNYFGDACVWWGLYLLAADQWIGLATVLSPLVITWLLTKGSGKPLVEAHLIATRPEYAAYAARTSGFLPRKPKQV